MATMPTFSDGHLVLASDWNAHANQINTNTDAIAANSSAISTNSSDIDANDADISSLDSRVTSLEDNAGGGTQADDTTLYGDVISNNARVQSWYGNPASNGYTTVAATISPKSFTANELRIAVLSPAASNDGNVVTFDLKLYKGPSVQNLSEVGSWFGDSHVTTTGVKTFSLSGLPVNAGDALAIAVVVTEAETSPALASTPSTSNTAALVNSGTSVYSTYKDGQTYPLPGSIDTTDPSWTSADRQFWFALA